MSANNSQVYVNPPFHEEGTVDCYATSLTYSDATSRRSPVSIVRASIGTGYRFRCSVRLFSSRRNSMHTTTTRFGDSNRDSPTSRKGIGGGPMGFSPSPRPDGQWDCDPGGGGSGTVAEHLGPPGPPRFPSVGSPRTSMPRISPVLMAALVFRQSNGSLRS